MVSAIRRIGVICAFVVFSVIAFSSSAIAAEDGAQKAVLVTGASTGIGRKITEVLADEGYFVPAFDGSEVGIDTDEVEGIEARNDDRNGGRRGEIAV